MFWQHSAVEKTYETKSERNALYFQEVTLRVYISLKNSPLQERRDFPEYFDEKSIWLKAANHRKKRRFINKNSWALCKG